MFAEVLAEVRGHHRGLADYLEAVADKPLRFDGDNANRQSGWNHETLGYLELLAPSEPWINSGLRTRFVEAILQRWQARLKGMAPYQAQGYRLYVYESLALTVSAVAETEGGFPYPGQPKFVDHPRDVAKLFQGGGLFERSELVPVTPKEVLAAVEKHNGSISKPTAQALGLQVGDLRKWIEFLGLADQVNALRKRNKRRPAQFRSEEQMPEHSYHIYERRLPAGY